MDNLELLSDDELRRRLLQYGNVMKLRAAELIS
jgi:hypothetical protein